MTASKSKTAPSISWQSDPLTSKFAADIAEIWQDLALCATEKNIFNFPWFIIPSLPLLEEKKPEILTVFQDDLLIGLLIICPDRGYAKLPLSFARTALHPDQFLGMPLVRDGYADQFAAGLCEWLDAGPSKVSFLLLSSLTVGNELTDAIVATCKAQNRHLVEAERFERAAIASKAREVADTDTLLSKSRRKSLRRKMKQLSDEGTVTIEKLSDEADIEAWLCDFINMENSGWKKENGSSILSQSKDVDFYHAMIPTAFRKGAVNFFRLCVAGKPIAYTLDMISAPDAYCMKTAFDQEYKRFSPGVLMEFETLKYYREHPDFSMVDSCTDPDNEMLNEMWPDRKAIVSLLISRTDEPHRSVFSAAYVLKSNGLRFLENLSGGDKKHLKKIC